MVCGAAHFLGSGLVLDCEVPKNKLNLQEKIRTERMGFHTGYSLTPAADRQETLTRAGGELSAACNLSCFLARHTLTHPWYVPIMTLSSLFPSLSLPPPPCRADHVECFSALAMLPEMLPRLRNKGFRRLIIAPSYYTEPLAAAERSNNYSCVTAISNNRQFFAVLALHSSILDFGQEVRFYSCLCM